MVIALNWYGVRYGVLTNILQEFIYYYNYNSTATINIVWLKQINYVCNTMFLILRMQQCKLTICVIMIYMFKPSVTQSYRASLFHHSSRRVYWLGWDHSIGGSRLPWRRQPYRHDRPRNRTGRTPRVHLQRSSTKLVKDETTRAGRF